MVFFYLFLFVTTVLNKFLKKPLKNEYILFFLKNINLKKKIYNPEDNNYYFDYRTEQQINDAKNVRPFLFKDAYVLYRFFITRSNAKKSFNSLNAFFGVNNSFLSFFFLYIFLYYRCFRINFFYSKKTEKIYRNKYFYELFFLVFYFFKNLTFKNNHYYSNKYFFILENLKKLAPIPTQTKKTTDVFLPNYEKIKKTTQRYTSFMGKYIDLTKNQFLRNNIKFFISKLFNKDIILNTNIILKKK